MERTSRKILKIGIQRGYFDERLARRVRDEARQRGCSAERVLLERRIVSVRRLERLRTHLRYRELRKSDKRYGRLAVKWGLVGVGHVREALSSQRETFEAHRACVRLGCILIEHGLLSERQDRELRKASHRTQKIVSPAASRSASRSTGRGGSTAAETLLLPHEEDSAAAVPLQESSRIGESTRNASYRAIEAALERVEALRAMADDLSTSEQVGLDHYDRATPDSAAEFENACTMLARRRVGSSATHEARRERRPRSRTPKAPRKRSRRRATSTSKLRSLLFNSHAA